MRNTILVTMIALLTFVGKAYAEMSYGISVAATKIDASGTETEGGETTNGDAENHLLIPSFLISLCSFSTSSIESMRGLEKEVHCPLISL